MEGGGGGDSCRINTFLDAIKFSIVAKNQVEGLAGGANYFMLRVLLSDNERSGCVSRG